MKKTLPEISEETKEKTSQEKPVLAEKSTNQVVKKEIKPEVVDDKAKSSAPVPLPPNSDVKVANDVPKMNATPNGTPVSLPHTVMLPPPGAKNEPITTPLNKAVAVDGKIIPIPLQPDIFQQAAVNTINHINQMNQAQGMFSQLLPAGVNIANLNLARPHLSQVQLAQMNMIPLQAISQMQQHPQQTVVSSAAASIDRPSVIQHTKQGPLRGASNPAIPGPSSSGMLSQSGATKRPYPFASNHHHPHHPSSSERQPFPQPPPAHRNSHRSVMPPDLRHVPGDSIKRLRAAMSSGPPPPANHCIKRPEDLQPKSEEKPAAEISLECNETLEPMDFSLKQDTSPSGIRTFVNNSGDQPLNLSTGKPSPRESSNPHRASSVPFNQQRQALPFSKGAISQANHIPTQSLHSQRTSHSISSHRAQSISAGRPHYSGYRAPSPGQRPSSAGGSNPYGMLAAGQSRPPTPGLRTPTPGIAVNPPKSSASSSASASRDPSPAHSKGASRIDPKVFNLFAIFFCFIHH